MLCMCVCLTVIGKRSCLCLIAFLQISPFVSLVRPTDAAMTVPAR